MDLATNKPNMLKQRIVTVETGWNKYKNISKHRKERERNHKEKKIHENSFKSKSSKRWFRGGKGRDGSEVIMKQLLDINFPDLRIYLIPTIKRAE